MRWRTLLLLIPLAAFWVLAWLGIQAGEQSRWQRQSAELWRNSRWEELNALASNLDKLHKTDSQTTCMAAIAGYRLQQRDRAQHHASRFLQSRALNWKCEEQIAALHAASSNPLERIALYRTRIVFVLLALVGAMNIASFLARRDLLPWTAAVAAAGCLILLL